MVLTFGGTLRSILLKIGKPVGCDEPAVSASPDDFLQEFYSYVA
jgi:hypothetical protein